jgi:hypothetical protein
MNKIIYITADNKKIGVSIKNKLSEEQLKECFKRRIENELKRCFFKRRVYWNFDTSKHMNKLLLKDAYIVNDNIETNVFNLYNDILNTFTYKIINEYESLIKRIQKISK